MVGRFSDDPVELGAVILYQTDIFNDHVIDLPVLVYEVEPVVDGDLFPLLCDDNRLNFGIVPILDLVRRIRKITNK